MKTDPKNCGLCGTTCTGGSTCQGGSCACPAGQDFCGDTCVNRQTDVNHCGTCDRACAPGQRCCNGVCKSVGTDVANCGDCGRVCVVPMADRCSNGTCSCGGGAACPGGQTCCPGGCRSVGSDINNCSACGAPCNTQTADRCISGSCQCGSGAACSSGQTCCNGVCKSLGTDPSNCGFCGNVCPGLGTNRANVRCVNSACTFSCQGDAYDVDGNPANGCEQMLNYDTHTQATALYLGSHSCDDSKGGSYSGTMLSDARVHENPGVTSFSSTTGSAPQWAAAYASGGTFCQNDPRISLSMSGASNNCYRLLFTTDKGTWSANVVNGSAVIDLGSGSYSDDTYVYFMVEKICSVAVAREVASYTVSFKL